MPQRRLGKRRYSSYSFPTLALDGGEWSASRPGRALGPGKGPRYPLYRRLGGPQSRFGHRGYRKKSFRLSRGSNLDRPAVQPLYWQCYPAHQLTFTNTILILPAMFSFRPPVWTYRYSTLLVSSRVERRPPVRWTWPRKPQRQSTAADAAKTL
jgi:hypothetical protein